MANFQRTVQDTPPAIAHATLQWQQRVTKNLAQQGFAQHYARVDADFPLEKRYADAVDQSIDFTPVTTGAESIARANLLKSIITKHLADGTYAHSAADATSAAISAADATDTATCTTLLLEVKITINAHLQFATPHSRLPASILLVTTVPADEATNITAVNEILILYRRHFYSAAEELVLGTAG